ncbi:MAG TPA: hypothetical protein VIF57_05775 [Polyangia bacterium]|jgi:hypothetical protein
MATDPAEAMFDDFIKLKGWHLTPVSEAKQFLEERLKASFVWRRIQQLIATVPDLPTRLDDEIDLVNDFLRPRLGDNRTSGPLLQPRAAGETDKTSHVDLADLARQSDSNDAKQIKARKAAFLNNRIRAALMITWRAVTVESDKLWGINGALDTEALAELFDRRLRIVERTRCNVGAQDRMMSDNGTQFNFVLDPALAQPTSNWLDGLRVRLFEYFEYPAQAKLIPGFPGGQVWDDNGADIQYAVFPFKQRTSTDGRSFAQDSGNPWRFPADAANNWEVSFGRSNYYGIDFVPQPPRTPAACIDQLFDLQGKQDIWNRAWLLCDMVLSSLQLDALLLGLRRRYGVATGEQKFATVAGLRPTADAIELEVGDDDHPQTTTASFEVAFVSLDGHVRNQTEQGPLPDPATATVLMRSDQVAPSPFVDPYFRNQPLKIDDLQVGDQVKFLNSPVYDALTFRKGIWGLENAIVMEFEPASDLAGNRTSAALSTLRFQGHGTDVVGYDQMRGRLGRELQDVLVSVYRRVVASIQNNDNKFLWGRADDAKGGKEKIPIFRWAPFADINRVVIADRTLVNGKPTERKVSFSSAPWWIPIPIRTVGGTVERALAAVPHSIGAPDVDLTIMQAFPNIPELRLQTNQALLSKFVLFPLFEPTVAPSDKSTRREIPWRNYFASRKASGPQGRQFMSLDADSDMTFVPGLFYFDPVLGLKQFGSVRPQVTPKAGP